MARPLRIQYPGAYYHVTCRGNERRKIFLEVRDENIFFEKLALSIDIYNVSLLVYVCMANHFHLLLTTPEGNLSAFMRHFNISYTSAFNRRHNRVGHLYQGRYKALVIEAEAYLVAVSRYIHLNPIRTRAFEQKTVQQKWDALLSYGSSSLGGYLSQGKRADFVNYQLVLDYMGGDTRKGRSSYRQFIQEGMTGKIENPLAMSRGTGIIGGAAFVRWIKERFLAEGVSGREQPAVRGLRRVMEPDELIDRVAQLVGVDRDYLCQPGRHLWERLIVMELLYRYSQITQPEIGRLMGGIDYSAVSRARRKLQGRLEREPQLRQRFDEVKYQILKTQE